MFQINEAKFTEFDRQVVTMARLTPGAWSLRPLGMSHDQLGDFTKGTIPFVRTMQRRGGEGNKSFRQLSWRAQIVLAREHRHMLGRAVDVNEKPAPEVVVPLTQPSGMASPQQRAQKLLGEHAARQAAMRQQMHEMGIRDYQNLLA